MSEPRASTAAGETIATLLAGPGDGYADDLVAIAAPDRPALGFGELRGLMREPTAARNGLGIGRGDRVGRLAEFKVPRRIVFLAEIPQGPTGKLQRIGLAAKLGLVS